MGGISRRTLFVGAGLAAAAAGEAQSKGSRKLKVMVAGGHPGDPEYGSGGTVARYTDLGHEVVLLYLNRGDSGYLEKPVEDASPMRVAEATKACGVPRAREPDARPVLRIADAGDAIPRHRERVWAGGSVHPACPEPI